MLLSLHLHLVDMYCMRTFESKFSASAALRFCVIRTHALDGRGSEGDR